MPEPALIELTVRERIHVAIDSYLDFALQERVDGLMVVEIPLMGGRPRRYEVQVLDRRQPPASGRKALTGHRR